MRDETIWCDLCELAGYEKRKAVGQYWDASGRRWDICQRCLKLVKEAGLEYELFAYRKGAQDAV